MCITWSDLLNLSQVIEMSHGRSELPWDGQSVEHYPKQTMCTTASCNLSVSSDPLADQMKKWWGMETYASVCDVSGRSKKEKRVQAILEKNYQA